MLDYADSRLIAGGVPKGRYSKEGKEHPFYRMYQKAKAGIPNTSYLNFRLMITL